MIYMYIVN